MSKPVRRFSSSAALSLVALLAATLAASLSACGSSETAELDGSLVRLHLVGDFPNATRVILAVTATPASGPVKSGTKDFATGPFEVLGVTFPAGAVATTQYQVQVYDSANCLIATGSASLPISSDGIFEVTVQLTAVPLCGNAAKLTVQVVNGVGGAGTVTSSPAGISCAGAGPDCTHMFMKNAQITLHAASSTGGFSGWSGVPNCAGVGDCTLTLDKDTQVQAVFTACHGWCQETQPVGTGINFLAISGSAVDNVVVSGDKGTVLRWNGQSWQQQTTAAGNTIALRAVFAKPAGSKLYVAGDVGTILQLSGGTWSSITNASTANLRAIATGSSGNTYFIGESGSLMALSATGTSVTDKTSSLNAGGTVTLNDISQNPNNSSNDDLFIVGNGGYAVAWDGKDGGVTTQSKSGGGTILTGSINAMLGGGAFHYAAGDNGGISRRATSGGNSNKWQVTTPAPTTQHLRGLWASSDTNIYAVGDGGTILQFDGATWTAVKVTNQPTFKTNLRAVWGTSNSNVYAVGQNGTILHYLP